MSFTKSEIASSRRSSADSVAVDYVSWSEDQPSGVFITATNTGKVPRKAAWVRLEKRFDPPINLKDHQGLNVTIVSETGGAIAAIRLESPHHMAYGAVADYYIDLVPKVCRRFNLVETESSRWSDYVWNDSKGLYNVYRETINFGAVESISLWLQNIEPGREIKVSVGPISAIPLRPVVLKNPKLAMGDKSIEFPVELLPGSWIECNGPDDCAVYGSKGEALGKVTPRGSWPILKSGVTPLTFSSESGDEARPRARVTFFNHGEEL